MNCLLLAHLTPKGQVSYCYHWSSVLLAFCILINSSKTTWTKLWWNGPWVVPFQNCVRQPRPSFKMVAITKNRKFGNKSLKNYLLWNFWANWAQTMVEWSSDDPLWELCSPTKIAAVTKNRKFGKKSLKNDLLWNCWVKWAQTMVKWSLDGPLSELYPTTPPIKEDGGHC